MTNANNTNSAIDQCKDWIDQAQNAEIERYDACCLATVSQDNKPSARMVLYKGFIDDQLMFVTNYNSRKAKELDNNHHVAITFYWKELKKQLRIEGEAIKAGYEISAQYFNTRPRMSQIGALASKQSAPLESTTALTQAIKKAQQQTNEQPIKCPPHWGAYLIDIQQIEFWQEGQNRLHQRNLFTCDEKKQWHHQSLYP